MSQILYTTRSNFEMNTELIVDILISPDAAKCFGSLNCCCNGVLWMLNVSVFHTIYFVWVLLWWLFTKCILAEGEMELSFLGAVSVLLVSNDFTCYTTLTLQVSSNDYRKHWSMIKGKGLFDLDYCLQFQTLLMVLWSIQMFDYVISSQESSVLILYCRYWLSSSLASFRLIF